MHIPAAFREEDVATLVSFMQAHSFATLITMYDQRPVASHVPLVVTQQADQITLTGHLAKANPQWQGFGDHESLAIFAGPHAYISPSAYTQRESVPTWNYIAVHAYGQPRPITLSDAPDAMDEMIDEMIDTYGADYKAQWHSLSERYRNGMMRGIVGFELVVTRLDGQYKLSQNRDRTDQANIAHDLLNSPDSAAQAIGAAMQRNLDRESST